MSLTKERINEIALKCFEEEFGYGENTEMVKAAFNLFLSRIREEQEPYDFMSESKNNKNVHTCVDKDYPGNVKWTKAFPVFTIPPAAPEKDCKELVEVLEKDAERYRFIASSKSEGNIDLVVCQVNWSRGSYDVLTDDRANAYIDAALTKHKASMGEK